MTNVIRCAPSAPPGDDQINAVTTTGLSIGASPSELGLRFPLPPDPPRLAAEVAGVADRSPRYKLLLHAH